METQLSVQVLRGGADVDKNNSGEIKPSDGKDGSNPSETKSSDGKDDSNPGETKPSDGKDDSNPDETKQNIDRQMILVPGRTYSILKTEVTQEFYESVMGENPSEFNGEKNLSVEKVIWYDAVEFCNKLSAKCGLTPVYAVAGETDVSEWGYVPNKGNQMYKYVTQDENANGYRLPAVEEWQYAAKGGQEFKYSGSYNSDEVGWYYDNSENKTHPVAQKKPNGYGLYDMSGNVGEWCWDSGIDEYRCYCGGSWYHNTDRCGVDYKNLSGARNTCFDLGFRIVRSTGK